MADDLEAFLRQAAQRRAQRKTSARSQPSSSRPQTPRPAQRQGQQSSGRTPRAEDQIVEAEVVAETPHHLASDLNSSAFGRYTSHIGEKERDQAQAVDLGRDQFEAHVHETFDHHVGALDDQPGMPKQRRKSGEENGSRADQIAKLLANPKSLRTAIVLSEVLAPRHFRW